jgi:MFS family permease
MLNAAGQSFPPLLFVERMADLRRKKWSLLASTLLMGLPFLALGALWAAFGSGAAAWLPAVFLALYFVFFAMVGVNQVVFNTLQGKLVRPERRGRLMGVSGTIGSVGSIVAAWWFLQEWLRLPDGGFALIFGFTGAGFAAAAFVAGIVREPPDAPDRTTRRGEEGAERGAKEESRAPTESGTSPDPSAPAPRTSLRDLLRENGDFRRLAGVSMLFVAAQILFPHYQNLGRQLSGYEPQMLMVWVCVQNAGTGLFSVLAGVIADRRGNRAALRVVIGISAVVPCAALWCAGPYGPREAAWYWVVFGLLGVTPVTYKTFFNYALELVRADQHSRALSTLRVCLSFPILSSPLVGFVLDRTGFGPVFLTAAVLIAAGGIATLGLREPRHEGFGHSDPPQSPVASE